MYEHKKNTFSTGTPVAEAKAALIMLHGRGATADSIAALANHFQLKDTAIYAPQAAHNSWYPYSFMAPDEENQPALNSALSTIDELVKQIESDGIAANNIYFAGFSQGACLTLEYVTRRAKRYGGAVAFTGGLIGEDLNMANYGGNFEGTPVLISTGDPDPHVPLSRVQQSVEVMKGMGANVALEVFKGRPHTIIQQEIDLANKLVFNRS